MLNLLISGSGLISYTQRRPPAPFSIPVQSTARRVASPESATQKILFLSPSQCGVDDHDRVLCQPAVVVVVSLLYVIKILGTGTFL